MICVAPCFRADFCKSEIGSLQSKITVEARGITLPLVHPIPFPFVEFCIHAFGFGGKGIRTPDFQLAKLALYQLSYAPDRIAEFRLANFDCKGNKTECRMSDFKSTSGTRCFSCVFYCEMGTAKYAINAPVFGSTALPVISPLLFMSFALARKLE